MVQVSVVYRGGLCCEATHGPSGAPLLTDAPVDNHGQGRSFSPTDLVATALGTCVATIMAIAAERHGVDLTGLRVTVTKEMAATPRRRIARLETVVEAPAVADAAVRARIERAAAHCPVHASLGEDTEAPVVFRWNEG